MVVYALMLCDEVFHDRLIIVAFLDCFVDSSIGNIIPCLFPSVPSYSCIFV